MLDAIPALLARELPPRARRILQAQRQDRPRDGTTSACAENTYAIRCVNVCMRNYLRVRGEYVLDAIPALLARELPPRARRILQAQRQDRPRDGTTSACAENTYAIRCVNVCMRNYLRVRGEYCEARKEGLFAEELPPRARRIQPVLGIRVPRPGTTSACAENTEFSNKPHSFPWNYLRVRGEYIAGSLTLPHSVELPPRARRIPAANWLWTTILGTTSACAENTSHTHGTAPDTRNYLRVRGEYKIA